ncbi:uncharacterized protein C8Q71DRAFT_857789 [Rhodofomes roseus]|uniref:Alpha-type protein kinase domain-containing protein n=1 Tax=Rhodofomes roseus TaxID=34475 RepID=A0ABQ8KFK7_9APHY|nr:uncharacterized protein C8Q71DRAFT_857789 [Rhodofomes roseus]KAH9836558.1 hypothetical protein C8Q71DRAFT_857789 [Rhodofomes roseus]
MALYSSQQATRCQRQNCPNKNVQNQGQLRLLRSAYQGMGAKMLCQTCYDYYVRKGAREGIPVDGFQSVPSVPSDAGNGASRFHISKDIAAAQRGEAAHVVAIGQGGRSSNAMLPPPVPAGRAGQFKPAVHVPGGEVFNMLRDAVAISRERKGTKLGYQSVHQYYHRIREMLQRNARDSKLVGPSDVVVVKASMVTLEEGKKRPIQVGTVQESIGDVPVHIGARALKDLVFTTLYSVYGEWSHEALLTYDECTLRNKDRVPILPLGEGEDDRDALPLAASLAQKDNARMAKPRVAKVNNLKPIEVVLEIPWGTYTKARSHKRHREAGTEPENDDIPDDAGSMLMVRTSKIEHLMPRHWRSSDAALDSANVHNEEAGVSYATTAPVSKSPIMQENSDRSYYDRPSHLAERSVARSLLRVYSVNIAVSFRVYPNKTFAALVREAGDSSSWNSQQPPIAGTVFYSPASAPQLGAFKAAFFGQTSPALPDFPSSGSVVLKQIYIRRDDTELRASAAKVRIDFAPSGQQIVELGREILCLQWASALMNIVYEFLAGSARQPPFPIPVMRFVRVALAIEDKESIERKVFMVEERIDPREHGVWRKYINNNSPTPLLSTSCTPALQHIADFLVFCQHVQYIKTSGLAFVSDFQGGTTLLSDPQIITAPQVGDVFAGGNITSAYTNFVAEHDCSKFCKFFSLEEVGIQSTRRSNGLDTQASSRATNRKPASLVGGVRTHREALQTAVPSIQGVGNGEPEPLFQPTRVATGLRTEQTSASGSNAVPEHGILPGGAIVHEDGRE